MTRVGLCRVGKVEALGRGRLRLLWASYYRVRLHPGPEGQHVLGAGQDVNASKLHVALSGVNPKPAQPCTICACTLNFSIKKLLFLPQTGLNIRRRLRVLP